MEYAERIEAIDRSRRRIVECLTGGDLDATVPTCPDFTLDRLAFHLGEFSGFWTHVLCEATSREKPDFSADPGSAGRAAWVDRLITQVLHELRQATATTPCWTWFEPDQSAGFVASRVCHELEIHRVDVQLAANGVADPVTPTVAVAGIEEIFLMMSGYGVDFRRGVPGNGETLQLSGTDQVDATWFVRLDPERTSVTREHSAADLELRATASDLEMLLYQRPTNGAVEWLGDRTVLDVFHGEFTFG